MNSNKCTGLFSRVAGASRGSCRPAQVAVGSVRSRSFIEAETTPSPEEWVTR